ncbi:hypothetical protein [Listeria monocytogenes]|uniref:hypothetical protein n=1 Tax=Listeria monocytogenes TaxID=1639 RepID=UPI000869C8B8|nr:hypothetical protein [Listeria monocytogenes]OEQ03090.1 hypothetical protein AJN05_02940 [Listeria monocytogenes]RKC93096.1 hypothetical protein AF891_01434 [Listeria monocytogenes]
MKNQFTYLINNKTTQGMFILILLIPCIEIVQLYIMLKPDAVNIHPAFAFFLAGSSRGHITQILLLWFLPVLSLLLGADSSIQEYQTGVRNIIINKIGKKSYILQKLAVSFILCFITMFTTLLLNFILVSIIFLGGTYKMGLNGLGSLNTLFDFSIQNPYLADIGFGFMACLMAGMAGLIATSSSLFFLNKKFAYPAAFFIWFLMILPNNSIMFIFQSFTEYGFEIILPIFLVFSLIVLIIVGVLYLYEVKYVKE